MQELISEGHMFGMHGIDQSHNVRNSDSSIFHSIPLKTCSELVNRLYTEIAFRGYTSA